MNVELINLNGVGEKLYRYFKDKGIWNTYDLVSYLPKKYENFAQVHFDELKHNEVVTVSGYIETQLQIIKKKVHFLSTFLNVDNHSIKLLIFGRSYLENKLNIGTKVIVRGKFNLFTREINVSDIMFNHNTPEIKPIYGIENVSDLTVRKLIKEIFDKDLVDIYETLPKEIIHKYHVIPRKRALELLHFPTSKEDLDKAIERLKREEAFLHLLSYIYQLAPKTKREPILYDINVVKSYIKQLPYQLTLDQQEAVNDIFRDYKKNESLYRLIQGDVGSGKTFVGFLAAIGMISAGYQVAFMAPTEILARQHFENFKAYFSDISAELLTSTIQNKKEVLINLENGKTKIVFGTHILASNQSIFKNLGLVIIDEQHKFGVEVRDELIGKAVYKDTIYLTATPIPRSLTLTAFGDLETSIIRMKPVIKAPVKTHLISDDDFEAIASILRETQKRDEQSFIVVPAILENNKKHTIHSVYARLEILFNDENLYVIHGKLKPQEIEDIMNRFINNPRGILLSTSIIEVGIDVKNATTMIIMGAENFGLSSLHQLRGRIGRGSKSGNCYLASANLDKERLQMLTETNDGFLLAEYDLKLRGPGQFSGVLQSGQLNFKYIDLSTDLKLLTEMKNDAKYFAENIEKYQYLKKRILNIK
ncbi:ATP-dependent DNA helicase RecG [Acholeplasma hippikon]|nr:ATP-dependent DNA helicase RecG [Acholeplasma hippikon]